MSMKLVPYVSFGPLQFGQTTKVDCLQLLGEPLHKRTNRIGIEEFEYEEFIIRFHGTTLTVRECTLLPRADATVNDVQVTWDQRFLRAACNRDPSPREAYGFIVFVGLGIAVTGIHDNDESQLAVTAFSREELANWISKSVPFELPQEWSSEA